MAISPRHGQRIPRSRGRRKLQPVLRIGVVLACLALTALGLADPVSAAGPADGVALTAPAAPYYGVGVMPNDTADSAYMDMSPVHAEAADGGTTAGAQLAFGDPSTHVPFTLRFTVSSGTTGNEVQYGTVERPADAEGAPILTAPILLYVAGTGSTPIGTLVTLQLDSRYVADPHLRASDIDLEVNGVRYAVGSPASIPLRVGSLIQLRVEAFYLATPNLSSSLVVSLLPTLTPGSRGSAGAAR